ncbi:hypothetical protein [Aquimarina sediminis]|nr:hypothetical protein [Aquimarina sediminis]
MTWFEIEFDDTTGNPETSITYDFIIDELEDDEENDNEKTPSKKD